MALQVMVLVISMFLPLLYLEPQLAHKVLLDLHHQLWLFNCRCRPLDSLFELHHAQVALIAQIWPLM